MNQDALLKFQIGPVQDFIAAARSTRDLWSGSYLLSWLVAAGIRKLADEGGTLIFPNPEGQPLLKPQTKWPKEDQKALLTPNLPNLFVAQVPCDAAKDIAVAVCRAIDGEWKNIAKAVWEQHPQLDIPAGEKTHFDNTVAKHLSIAWQITPIDEHGYTKTYRANGHHLDGVRQIRHFEAWGEGRVTTGHEKDSLTGKETALCGGTEFQKKMQDKGGEIPSLFKHADQVGPITLIKRVWHVAYLRKAGLETGSGKFVIRSIPAIATRTNEVDDEASAALSGGEKYIAAIAFDGDSIGQWMDGKELKKEDQDQLREHHRRFSAALSDFALKGVRGIIEEPVDGKDKTGKSVKIPLGQLIYAGGDDVVALVPADAAIECAAALRKAFREATSDIKDEDGNSPDASAGIAIAHIHSPLQDLIRAAQVAERRAKKELGRLAFSVALMKRSGEISHWGAKWEDGGMELYQAIADLLDTGALTGKFPHRVCALLEPYVIAHTGLAKEKQTLRDAPDFQTREIIAKEFAFAVSRQSAAGEAHHNTTLLTPLLTAYLAKLDSDPQTLLTTLIGLCTTVAFAHRTRPETKSDTKSETPKGTAVA